MYQPRSRLVEHLRGKGQILDGDASVGTVLYDLRQLEDVIVTKTSSGQQEIPGMKSIDGLMRPLNGGPFSDRDNFILKLDDGRQLPIVIKRAESSTDSSESYSV